MHEKEPEAGTHRRVDGRTEVWSGDEWITARDALEDSLVEWADVAELVRSEVVGGGAFGGPAEYTIAWRIWRLDDHWVLDQSDEGMDYTSFDALKDCEEEWQRQVDELRKYSSDADEEDEPRYCGMFQNFPHIFRNTLAMLHSRNRQTHTSEKPHACRMYTCSGDQAGNQRNNQS